MKVPANLRQLGLKILDKYSIVIGALFIYGYYLLLTLDLFEQHREKLEVMSLLMQFDSLILMWALVVVLVQLGKRRQETVNAERQQRDLIEDYQRKQFQLGSLDDITDMLTDKLNNSLSLISLSTHSIRERTYRDVQLGHDIEKMESALRRIQEILMGLQSYCTRKIIKESSKSDGVTSEAPGQ